MVGAAAPHKMASGSGVDPVELVNELTSFATTVPDELTQYVLGTVGVELQVGGWVLSVVTHTVCYLARSLTQCGPVL